MYTPGFARSDMQLVMAHAGFKYRAAQSTPDKDVFARGRLGEEIFVSKGSHWLWFSGYRMVAKGTGVPYLAEQLFKQAERADK